MIDPTNRISRLLQEARDPEVGVIVMDFVLGFGSHEDPVGVMLDAIVEAKATSPQTVVRLRSSAMCWEPILIRRRWKNNVRC
jgi:hypothetical protein